MSGAFHALLIGWLVFFSPVRVINLETTKAEYTAGSARIREVMDQVRERQADLLAASVRDLQEIQLELAELQARKFAEFDKFSTEFAHDAPALAEEAQAAAAQAQSEALAAQAATASSMDNLRQKQEPEDFKAVQGAQKKAESAQDRVGQPQDRALQALGLSDASYETARQAQAQANGLQQRANTAQVEAAAKREDSEWLRGNARNKARDLQRDTESLQKAETEAETAKGRFAQAEAALGPAKEEAEQASAAGGKALEDAEKAKTEAAQARSTSDKLATKDPGKQAARQASTEAQTKANEARRLADQARNTASQTKQRAESAQRKLDSTRGETERALARVTEHKTRLERTQTEADQARSKAEEAETKVAQAQAAANDLQTEAQQAQAKARQALATARLNAATNALAAVTNSFDFSTNIPSTLPDVSHLELADLYQTAVNIENQSTETYKRIRAAEMAMLRQIPLPRALQLTYVAKVVRPNLKPSLQAVVTAGEDVPAAREAVQAAASEINAMVTLGTSLLAQAKGLDHGGSAGIEGATISLDWIRAQTGQIQAMDGLAAEDDDERAKDLSAAMQGNKGAGEGAGAGAAGGRAGAPGASGRGGGAMPGGKGGPGGLGFGGPPAFPKKLDALPGRKLVAGGDSTRWMYVDSWYIIGPFDNPKRENMEKKFPPETVVDLNATYTGKNNQPIRWEFFQAAEPRVIPVFDHYLPEKRRLTQDDWRARGLEYIIYYAYTELFFDQACDLWIAVGSDDFSKIWIDDQLVWASGKQQKSWRVDEGFRKVHFKQGLNHILYRIENGWHATDFSLVICLR